VDRFELLSLGDSTPDAVDDLSDGGPERPLLPSVPVEVYQSEPLLIIRGTLAQVSTLFRTLGLPQIPLTEVRIYLGLGSGGFPSIDLINALDSPETNIPISICTST